MSRHERRYLKYLERRQKSGAATNPTAAALARISGRDLELAVKAPLHEALVPKTLFEKGIGNLVFSRSLPDGRIAMAAFLLDTYCLGVKNAFAFMVARTEYGQSLSRWSGENLQPVQASCFRKLVEGGVAYALGLGFSPHSDYALASRIFGDVQSAECPRRFEYGRGGKPFYISGPHESPAQVRAIVDQLERRLGAGNFDCLVVGG